MTASQPYYKQKGGGAVPNRTQEERDAQFRSIVDAYQTELLRLCCCCLQDRMLAEDAVQETFMKVYRRLDDLRPELNEKAWLYKIAMNCSRDILRGAWFKRINRRVTPEMIPDPAAPPLSDDIIDLNRAIGQLNSKQREVILLRYYQGFSETEIAGILGLSQSSVAGRLKRAKEQLQALLQTETGSGRKDI